MTGKGQMCPPVFSGRSLGMYVKGPTSMLRGCSAPPSKAGVDQGGASFFYPISIALGKGKKNFSAAIPGKEVGIFGAKRDGTKSNCFYLV